MSEDKRFRELIQAGETSRVEFKASLRFDLKERKVNTNLTHVVAKTIAGFMNSEGGTLLIGVADDGQIVGIEHDLETLTKKSPDGFELALRTAIGTYLGRHVSAEVCVRFAMIDGKQVAEVVCQKNPEPVFLKDGDKYTFYVRDGCSTRPLNAFEQHIYINKHFQALWVKHIINPDDPDLYSLPIRLLPTPPTCRVLPGSGVKLCVGRCGDVARDAEQGTEGVERIEPPVEAEGEFVEVGLQVPVTDPVMDAVQPRFQVCEDEMDDWQILLGDLRIAPFSDGEVFVAALGKAGVAAPVVGDERRARHNGALNEAAERLRAAVRHDGEPNPPGIATTLPLVELGARLALANLHSAGDKNLIVDATAFAARPAASPGFIDFDVLAGPAADPVLIRAHHPRAELVEDLERRLVARQAKLSPKLHGRHAGCLAGHQIGRPKPYAQRRLRARHDRSHRQSGVTAALAAAQDARTICEAERLSRRLTMGANKPVAPASLLKVGGAGRVVGKKSLELWERLWEPKIATLVNVHEHGRTLPLVAVGDNRIGKLYSIWELQAAEFSDAVTATMI